MAITISLVVIYSRRTSLPLKVNEFCFSQQISEMMKIKDFSWLNWFQLIFFFIWNASSSQRCSFCVCSLDFSPNSKRHLVPSLPALSFSSDCHLPLRCWISRAESRKVFSIVLSSVSYQKVSITSRPTSDSSWLAAAMSDYFRRPRPWNAAVPQQFQWTLKLFWEFIARICWK